MAKLKLPLNETREETLRLYKTPEETAKAWGLIKKKLGVLEEKG